MINYKMQLEALSPVFIGDGKKLTKKEYVYDDYKKQIQIIDIPRLYADLMQNNQELRYERYMMDSGDRRNLGRYLQDINCDKEKISKFTEYSFSTKDSIQSKKVRINDISTFIKDARNAPYIPGSSIKGVFRTALMVSEVLKNREKYRERLDALYIESKRETRRNRNYLKREIEALETEIFNTLEANKKNKKDATNSVMRGLLVSDSKPLSLNNLCLSQKIDYSLYRKRKPLPLFRESLKPGTKIEFYITIDEKTFNFTIEDILDGINILNQTANELFLSEFGREEEGDNLLYLGGGAGFLSKTIIYPFYGDEDTAIADIEEADKNMLNDYPEYVNRGVELTHRVFKKTLSGRVYRQHNHDIDLVEDISPHFCKCTIYNGRLYNMGLCRLNILEERRL